MTLSMTSPIYAGDIFDIKMYKALKVFLLRATDGSELVIKKDAVYGDQIKSASVAAKGIDPGVKAKILTPAEVTQLNDYVRYFEEMCAFYDSLCMSSVGFSQEQKDVIADLKQSLTFPEPFVKMPHKTVRNIEDASKARGSGNKALVATFITALRNPGGMEKLGQVVAGDLFNGNTDRFMPNANKQVTIGPYTFDLKTMVNLGNIMIVADGGGGFQASFLDYVDPNSMFKSLATPLATLESNAGEPWPGRVLVDKTRRKKFAKDIVSDLETVLHPKKSFFSMSTKLGSKAASRLEDGMVSGAGLIKVALERKYNPNKWTPGATDRYKLMCTVKA